MRSAVLPWLDGRCHFDPSGAPDGTRDVTGNDFFGDLRPPPVLLPGDPEAEAALLAGENATIVAAHPSASVAWAALAEEALDDDKAITAYAYARTGYHRGLDQLRRNGWKGFGPGSPFRHEPNRGFLRCVAALACWTGRPMRWPLPRSARRLHPAARAELGLA